MKKFVESKARFGGTMKESNMFFWLAIVLATVLAGLGIALGGGQVAASGRVSELFAGAISGSGRIETEARSLGWFDSIAIAYPATIIVQQGDKYLVAVEADDNLLPQLVTQVRDGALAIENSEGNYFKRVAPTQSVKITITVKDLQEIVLASLARVEMYGLETDQLDLSLKGAGEIVVTGLNADSLNVYLYGGKVTAAGAANNLSVSIGKSGEFNGTDLQTMRANVKIGGTAATTLRVSDSLFVLLSGAATVNYYGSPEVLHESLSGTASINKLGN